jgi:uncharacterized membrane protein
MSGRTKKLVVTLMRRRAAQFTLVLVKELVVLAYADEYRAAEVLATLQRLHAGSDLPVSDAVSVTRAMDWTVTLHQSVDLSQQWVRSTEFWRAFVASLVPTPGTFDCRTSAANFGLCEDFKRALNSELPPGSSAVLLFMPFFSLDQHIDELHRFGGALLHAPVVGLQQNEVDPDAHW